MYKKYIIFPIIVLSLNSCNSMKHQDHEQAWLDPSLPADIRASELLEAMTLEEKISLLSETAPEIQRLNIAAYNYGNEALHGLVRPGKATVFPQAIALGATFNPELIQEMAVAISDEARAKHNASGGKMDKYSLKGRSSGTLTVWSPTINMARDPRWGRTAETYGEDPFLTSQTGVAFVKGLQGDDPKHIKVAATPKHFAANNEEDNRFSCKAEIPERWLHDYYLQPFRKAVTEGKCLSVMSSYNAINGVPSTANHWLLTDMLRNQWGFNGYVVSDCGAISHLYDRHNYVGSLEEAAAAALNAGCDLECGSWCTYPYVYENYTNKALEAGLIEEATIDTAVARILRGRFLLGLFDPIESGPYGHITEEVIGSKKHQELALEICRQSIVLLKNDPVNGKKLLPIDRNKTKSIAVVGPNADVLQFGDYSGIPLNEAVAPLQGIINKVGDKVKVNPAVWIPQNVGSYTIPKDYFYLDKEKKDRGIAGEYYSNTNMEGAPTAKRADEQLNFEWINQPPDPNVPVGKFSGRWSGYLDIRITGKYRFDLNVSDGVRFYVDGKLLIDHWVEKSDKRFAQEEGEKNQWDQSIFIKARKDTASVWLKKGKMVPVKVEFFHEAGEAKAILNWETPPVPKDEIFADEIKAAANSELVIAVLGLGKQIEMEGRDKKNLDLPADQIAMVKAIQKVNNNIVILLINGSPVAISDLDENQPAIVEAWYPGEQGGNGIADVLFGDYSPSGRLPLTFYKSDRQLPPMDDYDVSKGRTYLFMKEKPLYPFGFGLSYTQFGYQDLKVEKDGQNEETVLRVVFNLSNTGNYNGDEVAQVYVKHLDSKLVQPIKQLKGFKRTSVLKGETKQVQVEIPVKELKYWDTESGKFILESGKYEIMVGASSEDIRLRKPFIL